ncbi:MAG: HAMP domain-containing protein, partial [Actinophytocola sp.]|nr:HAMP domain-containing protein [Actinophytocola sp.]
MTDAGQQQVPVEKLLGQEPKRPNPWRMWLGKLVQWRDWKLPVKLAAVTLVPIVIAVALGASTLSSQDARSDSYERIDSLLVLTGETSRLLDALQLERTATAAKLSDGIKPPKALKQTRKDVDGLIKPMTDAAAEASTHDSGVDGAVTKAESLLARLKSLRGDVSEGNLDTVEAIDEYSAITDALLKLSGAATARVSDEAVGGTPRAMLEVESAKEEVSKQQALVAFGAARGSLAPSELSQVRRSEVRIEDRLTNFDAVVSSAERDMFGNTVSEPSAEARSRTVRDVLGELGVPSEVAVGRLSANEWLNNSDRVFGQLGQVSEQLSASAIVSSNALVADSRHDVAIVAALLVFALLLAIVVVFVITRHLLHSLRVLRTTAMEVAEERLPAAVREIQEGKGADPVIEPVAVVSADEVGQVARAFDAVHSQALRLAVEQAGMREAYSSVFVNLSRRSQSLVQRQLQLIERLERDEEDADQLATLFQLDHLATRMRRNNENLMMLSGSDGGRRSGRPVSTADVLRAAVSEIEQYQRVVVQSPPSTKVVGHAASDLMRLLAELLDNATSFSPPETQVTVSTSVGNDGSMTVDVLDKGIGMNEVEVDEANARMGEASSIAMVTSRRMGLFVVGRLASRHGIKVALHGGKDIDGVRATVTVPAELVIGAGGGPLTSELPVITDSRRLARRKQPNAKGINGVPAPRTAAQAAAGVAKESDVEVSGTALFTPITDADAAADAKAAPGTGEGAKPLPQRASKNGAGQPGAAQGGKNGKNVAGGPSGSSGAKPGDAREPDESGELPSGKALFKPRTSPLSDWWKAAAAEAAKPPAEGAKPARSESTPIFDEMLSVWFRTTGGGDAKPKEGEQAPTGKQRENWTFAADENWRTVQEISQKAAPSTFTEVGLPRRQRGELLLPGSATGEQVESSQSRSALGRVDRPVRDPHDVRGRLSSFQRGVKRGKHRVTDEPAAANTETAASTKSPAAPPSKHSKAQPTSAGSAAGGATGSGAEAARKPQAAKPLAKRTPAKKQAPADAKRVPAQKQTPEQQRAKAAAKQD